MIRSLESKTPRKDIILVWVDKETLKMYGQYSSWTRSRYQWLLEELIKQKPKVIVFDYFFWEKVKPENVDWDLIERLTGLSTEQVDDLFDRYSRKIRQTRYISTIDRDFATLMKEFKNIVLPFSFRTNEDGTITNTFESWQHSIYENVAHLGYANVTPDTDGAIRTVTLNLFWQKNIAQVAVNQFLDKKNTPATTEQIGINYYAKPYSYPMVSFQNAYNGIWKDYAWKPVDISNSIVIIGDAHESLWDTHKTPVGKDTVMPGIEIIANQIQTLLDNSWIKTVSVAQQILMILLISVLCSFVFLRLHSLKTNVLVFLVLSCTVLIFSSKLFSLHQFFNPFPATFAVILPFFIFNSSRLLASYQEKERVRKIFARYVDKSIVDTIVDSGSLPSLTGEQKEMTVSFSDIEGFTSFSEQLDPKTLISTLNGFFEIANATILGNKGTLGKYIGDAVMSFWWAPVKHKNHATLACKTALEIREKLKKLNLIHAEKWLPELHLKFGINTGVVTVWSIWSELYSDYTVMWDNVNLASRLEWINKYYKTYILLSESTKKMLDKHFITREIDTIRVKWKHTPIKIYELLSDEKDEALLTLKRQHESGLKAYYKKNWYEALCAFVQNDSLLHDPIAKVFIERINQLQQTPPPADWDGVWNFESK